MKRRSHRSIKAIILILSFSAAFTGLLLSGTFKSIQAYDSYDYDYYGYYPDCTEAVQAERAKWDADGDGKIGLAEAIQALKIAAGE